MQLIFFPKADASRCKRGCASFNEHGKCLKKNSFSVLCLNTLAHFLKGKNELFRNVTIR